MLAPEKIPNNTPNTAVAANVLTATIEITTMPLEIVKKVAKFIVPKVCTKAPGTIRPHILPAFRMGTCKKTKIILRSKI